MVVTSTRILVAKTSLDGHWRGVQIVSRALLAAGFEVVLGGMLTADEIATIAVQEDVQLIGLNIGGSIAVVERILERLKEVGAGDIPVFAGGTVTPQGRRRLEQLGVSVHVPGSSLHVIVEDARRLIGKNITSGPTA